MATRREVAGSNSGGVLAYFQVAYFCRPHSVSLGSTQPLTEMSTKEFSWGKVRPARGTDNSAVLVVPNADSDGRVV